MNSLRDMLYSGNPGPAYTYTGGDPGAPSSFNVGGNVGLNVGSEVFRVQLSIAGLLMAAFVGLVLLHRSGNRFSVHV